MKSPRWPEVLPGSLGRVAFDWVAASAVSTDSGSRFRHLLYCKIFEEFEGGPSGEVFRQAAVQIQMRRAGRPGLGPPLLPWAGGGCIAPRLAARWRYAAGGCCTCFVRWGLISNVALLFRRGRTGGKQASFFVFVPNAVATTMYKGP